MALSDALKAETIKKPGPVCTVCILLTTLAKDDAGALSSALSDFAVTSAAISRALLSEGHRVAANTLSRHRRGDCLKS